MNPCFAVLVAAVLVLTVAADGPAAPHRQRSNPAFAPIEDTPGLPRVLLVGDSISIGYTVPVRELLKGKANVHRIPTNGGSTVRGLQHLKEWLGEGKWDVIHFNWGLHDLKREGEGKHQVPLEAYDRNLRKLVAQLKATGAKLIGCTTTPVPPKCSPPRTNDDVIAYNAVAKRIMEENDIPLDDLYAFVLPRMKELQLPDNVHFTGAGYEALAEVVAKSIETRLAQ